MKTKQSMDLFGEALLSYALGGRDKFYFKFPSGEISEHSLKRYFLKATQMTKSERKLISLSYGDILDVGCGTGNFTALLSKRGKTLGIDISKNVTDVAKMNGLKNCIVADIFSFPTKKKYDTITFFENNLGLGGTVDKTKKLLKKASSILKDDGQILAISKRLPNQKYIASRLKPVWKNKVGPEFGWIHFNIDFLSDLCKKEGLHLSVVQGNKYSYLVRIVKNNLLKRK